MTAMHPEVLACFDRHEVILRPDRDEPEWWAGAPSVVQTADGRFFLAARMRAWRYSCWLPVGDEIHVYAELTCADDTNEIRRFVLPARGLVRA